MSLENLLLRLDVGKCVVRVGVTIVVHSRSTNATASSMSSTCHLPDHYISDSYLGGVGRQDVGVTGVQNRQSRSPKELSAVSFNISIVTTMS